MEISNGIVSADGIIYTNTVEFNLYYGNDGTTSVCVLHCSSGPHEGNLIQITSSGTVSFRMSTSVEVFTEKANLNFDDVGDDVLFEYSSDSNDVYHFRLRHHTSLVLGFTDAGVALSTYSYGSDHSLLFRQEVL